MRYPPTTLAAVVEVTWHVGDVVRKLRQQKGWTQKGLAKRATVHHNTIVRLEDGDEGVQGRTLKQVADALGMSRQELWSLVPESKEPQRATEPLPPSSGGDRFQEAHGAHGSRTKDSRRPTPK